MTAQLALFAPEPVRRIGGGPPEVERLSDLAFSEPVKLELLAVAAASPDDWLRFADFRVPMDRYKIGFCMGHVLGKLVREGRLQEKKVYYGKGIEADRPGSPDYQGYRHNWKAVP